MSGFKINFKLQAPEKIKPFGKKPNYSLRWFGLTDGLLWIEVGAQTLYEYGEHAQKRFRLKQKYNDYYLARFAEDFSATFEHVSESVPQELYDSVELFDADVRRWSDRYAEQADDADNTDALSYDGFCELNEWRYARSFDSAHLVGGPRIGCFRLNDKIKIVWTSDAPLKRGISLWSSPVGCYEIEYAAFVAAADEFYAAFTAAMDRQIEIAVAVKPKKVKLDGAQIAREHATRRAEFSNALAYLRDGGKPATDWGKVNALYAALKHDLSKPRG